MELALGFYKTAKTDIRVAKILHENGEFANMIYHLQQGVEKLSKSFGLFNQIIQANDLKEISHNPKKVFTKPLHHQQKEFDKTAELEKIFPDLFRFKIKEQEVNLTGYNKKFRKASNSIIHLNPEDFLWISDEDLDVIKSLIEEIDTEIEINFDDIRHDFPELCKNIISQIEAKTNLDLTEQKRFLEDDQVITTIENSFKEAILISQKVMKLCLTLFFFSLITSEHNQLTRYPCICCGELPENNYNKDEVIIRRYIEIHEIMEKTILTFEEMYIKNTEA